MEARRLLVTRGLFNQVNTIFSRFLLLSTAIQKSFQSFMWLHNPLLSWLHTWYGISCVTRIPQWKFFDWKCAETIFHFHFRILFLDPFDHQYDIGGLGSGCCSRTSTREATAHQNIRNLSLESGQAEWEAAYAKVSIGSERMCTDGVGRSVENQKRTRPNIDVSSIMSRRHLWLMFNEYRWHKYVGMHQSHRSWFEQAVQDLPVAAHVCCSWFGARHEQFL